MAGSWSCRVWASEWKPPAVTVRVLTEFSRVMMPMPLAMIASSESTIADDVLLLAVH